MSFLFLLLKIIFKATSASEALFLRSIRFFRHQYHGMASSMSLWPVWQYRHNGRIRDMAKAAIEAIVDPGHLKHQDLRIGASEADFDI